MNSYQSNQSSGHQGSGNQRSGGSSRNSTSRGRRQKQGGRRNNTGGNTGGGGGGNSGNNRSDGRSSDGQSRGGNQRGGNSNRSGGGEGRGSNGRSYRGNGRSGGGNGNGFNRGRQNNGRTDGQRNNHTDVRETAPNVTGPTSEVVGVYEATERGDGFLRSPERNFAIVPADVRVPRDVVRRFGLRGGESIDGIARGPGPAERTLVEVRSINGVPAGQYANMTPFEELTVIDPRVPIRFETPGGPLSPRIVDLLTPIGRGQRGLLVAPPRTGKTVLLSQMAAAVATHHPELRMMMLLIDERPEEVTEMRRTIGATVRPDGAVTAEVFHSSNDRDPSSHVRLARLVISRAKRMVEMGEHVLIFLDSVTRLGRAFNNTIRSSGRTLSGGIDIAALIEPKSIFGAARNIEDGGSLTIMATALIDTGSRGDEFIFQEFKGTGNMELVLTRELADMRVFPAIDVSKSGTRKEELLFDAADMPKIHKLRRHLLNQGKIQQIETMIKELEKHTTNRAFLDAITA